MRVVTPPWLERSVARPCLGSVMALLLFGCAPMPAPVPHDAEVVRPYPDVRPAMAAFSGRWEGLWEPRHVQVVVVVEQILPSQARIVLATGGPGDGSWGRYVVTTPRDVRGRPIVSHRGRASRATQGHPYGARQGRPC